MLNILQAGLIGMERLFEQVQPNFVISFVRVTFGEYLAYLFAKTREIPFLNLRPTRIRSYTVTPIILHLQLVEGYCTYCLLFPHETGAFYNRFKADFLCHKILAVCSRPGK